MRAPFVLTTAATVALFAPVTAFAPQRRAAKSTPTPTTPLFATIPQDPSEWGMYQQYDMDSTDDLMVRRMKREAAETEDGMTGILASGAGVLLAGMVFLTGVLTPSSAPLVVTATPQVVTATSTTTVLPRQENQVLRSQAVVVEDTAAPTVEQMMQTQQEEEDAQANYLIDQSMGFFFE